MQFSEMPSLSSYLDTKLTVEVVPGKVTTQDHHLFANFSMASEEVRNMPPGDLFMDYFKPLLDELAKKINVLGTVCTKALSLPDKESKVIGVRCWKGRVPVNLYIARRPDPDRHQFLIDLHVQKVETDNG